MRPTNAIVCFAPQIDAFIVEFGNMRRMMMKNLKVCIHVET